MQGNRRFLIGGVIMLAALSYIIYGGMQEAIVYFVTPSELKAEERASADKFLRMGGMVVKGLHKRTLNNSPTVRLNFPVFFRGVGPPHRGQGRGRREVYRQRRNLPGLDHHGQARRRV